MILLLSLGATNWLAFPVAAGLVALVNWSRPYLAARPLLCFRAGRLLQRVTPKLVGFTPLAFTWACCVFTWRDLDPTDPDDVGVLAHEGDHGILALALGLLYPLVAYPVASLVAVIRGGNWYRDNWFERRAQRIGEAARAQAYREAGR